MSGVVIIGVKLSDLCEQKKKKKKKKKKKNLFVIRG